MIINKISFVERYARLAVFFGWAALASSFGVGAAAEPVCTKHTVNLHKARGPASPISWRVGAYMPLSRVEKARDWSKVTDLEGEAHWIANADLAPKFRCVVVRTDVASLHAAPNSTSPATDLRLLDRYTPLKKVRQTGDWVQVEDEVGHLAWINDSQVWKAR